MFYYYLFSYAKFLNKKVTGRFGSIPVRTPGRFGPIPFRPGSFWPDFRGGSFRPNFGWYFGPLYFI